MKLSPAEDVELKDIELIGINVRTDLSTVNSQDNLQELAESININGLMQAIVLRGPKGHKPYDVVVGQRRFLAHRDILKTDTIKATFTDDISNTEALLLSLSENLLRQDLNQADIAEAVTKLYIEFGRDERKVQKKLGLSIRLIRNYIKVEEQATPEIKELIKSKKLTMADAKRSIIAAQGSPEKANAIAKSISKLTKYEKTRAVEYGKSNPQASADDIVKTAKTPRIEETVIFNISKPVAKALKDAAKALELESEEIIISALTEWLKTNDFLISQ
jgi:ParB/RepB/Spo0J family partition protein